MKIDKDIRHFIETILKKEKTKVIRIYPRVGWRTWKEWWDDSDYSEVEYEEFIGYGEEWE
jgi:hypothetical protein